MKYIRSRSEYLKFHKSETLNEGGLENDINWGDSLVGRLFASIFRMGKQKYNSKRVDGLLKGLEEVFKKAENSPYLEDEVIKSEAKKVKSYGESEGLLDVLKEGDVSKIKSFIEDLDDDEKNNILKNISTDDKEVSEVLTKIESSKKSSKKSNKTLEYYLTGDDKAVSELYEDKHRLVNFYESVMKLCESNNKLDSLLMSKLDSNVKISEILSEIFKGSMMNNNTKIAKQLNQLLDGGKFKMKGSDSIYTKTGRAGNVITGVNDKKDKVQIDIKNDKSLDTVEKVIISEESGDDLQKRLIEYKEKLRKKFKIGDKISWLGSDDEVKTGKIVSFDNQMKPGKDKVYLTMDDIKTTKLEPGQIYVTIDDGRTGFAISVDKVKKVEESYEFLLEFKETDSLKIYPNIISRKIGSKKSLKDILLGIKYYIDTLSDDKIKKQFTDYLSKSILVEESSESSNTNNESVEIDGNKIKSVEIDGNKIIWGDFIKDYLSEMGDVSKNIQDSIKIANEKSKSITKSKESYVIDALEIVNIFRKASRLYTKTRIPSQRTGGKVTTSIANDWETIDGGTVDPNSPSGGPFRNIKLYDKWSDGVIKLINQYAKVLKPKESKVRIRPDGYEDSIVKPTRSIYDFIIDALDGDKISGYKNNSNQLTFLKTYFGEQSGYLIKKERGEKETVDKKVDDEEVSQFKEVNSINISTSNLYKITTNGSFKRGDSTLTPQNKENIIFVYVRVVDKDNKALYLFEDLKFIEDKVNGGSKIDTSETPSGSSSTVLMTLPLKNINKGKVDNVSFKDINKGDVFESNAANVNIEKIEVYNVDNNKVVLSGKKLGDIGDTSKIINKLKNK